MRQYMFMFLVSHGVLIVNFDMYRDQGGLLFISTFTGNLPPFGLHVHNPNDPPLLHLS